MDDIKKPDDPTVSPEDGGEDGKVPNEAIKEMETKNVELQAEIDKREQESKMMQMEIDKLKTPKELAPIEKPPLTDAELEKMMFDDPPAYTKEVEHRAQEKATKAILESPKIKAMIERNERIDAVNASQLQAETVLKKMGRDPKLELERHKDGIVDLWKTEPSLSVTEAVLRVMAEKGELSTGYQPQTHGVDGVGGAVEQDGSSIGDACKEAYIKSGWKEKHGTSLEEYAKRWNKTKENRQGRG